MQQDPTPFRIGTRGSPLALAQANHVAAEMTKITGTAPEIVVITTTGDAIQSRPLMEIGGKGLFTKEIEEALYAGDIDLAVHSMKDVPTKLPPGLEIASILEREDPRDVFIGASVAHPRDLPRGARIGTASLRRGAQVKALRPDLEVVVLRGNVQTRLSKLEAGEVDGTFLAKAGLNRLGITGIGTLMEPEEMVPAVAQGAVGIEIRSDDARTRSAVTPLNHPETASAVAAERALLAVLDGSCRTPIAAHAHLASADRLHLRGLVLTPDGARHWSLERAGPVEEAHKIGREAGAALKRDLDAAGIDPAVILGH